MCSLFGCHTLARSDIAVDNQQQCQQRRDQDPVADEESGCNECGECSGIPNGLSGHCSKSPRFDGYHRHMGALGRAGEVIHKIVLQCSIYLKNKGIPLDSGPG